MTIHILGSLLKKTRTILAVSGAALLLAACGGGDSDNTSSGGDGENNSATQGAPVVEGQVVAQVNGEEITIHELNLEVARTNIPAGADRRAIEENVLRAIVTRKIYEQRAIEAGLDRSPNILLDLRRTRSALLAQAYLRSRGGERQPVGRREAEQFVFSNPDIFANRTYYIFDSIIVPTASLTEEVKDEYEQIGNLNDVESRLLREDKLHQRRPYTVYSETLPSAMLAKMPELERDRKIFFLVQGASTYITQFQESRPAVLSGEEAIDAAIKTLTDRKSREFLVSVENEAVGGSDVTYLGDFASLAEKPENLLDGRLQNEIDDVVQSSPEGEDQNQ